MDAGVLALALMAGAVAAFNPCGFALLPAYLGLLVAAPDQERAAAVSRAARFAVGMTTGFVIVFGLAGLVLMPVATSLQRYLPVLTVLIGVVLVLLGLRLLTGWGLALPGLSGRGSAPTSRWMTQVGFGVSFALASLSCTLAPFLAVTAGSLRSGGSLGIAVTFLVYALGMGAVVLVLALAVALARSGVVSSMRRAGAVISRASGALLLVAGAYVARYGWFEIRVLSGRAVTDPVVSAAVRVQGKLTRGVIGLGPAGLLLTALLAAALLFVLRRRARSRPTGERVR